MNASTDCTLTRPLTPTGAATADLIGRWADYRDGMGGTFTPDELAKLERWAQAGGSATAVAHVRAAMAAPALAVEAAEWAPTATEADLIAAGYHFYVGACDPRGEAYRTAARAELIVRQQRAYDAYIAAGGQPQAPATPNTYRASDETSD